MERFAQFTADWPENCLSSSLGAVTKLICGPIFNGLGSDAALTSCIFLVAPYPAIKKMSPFTIKPFQVAFRSHSGRTGRTSGVSKRAV